MIIKEDQMKTLTKAKINKVIKEGTDQLNKAGYNTGYCEYWYNSNVSRWEKNGIDRLYINLKYGRTANGKSKWIRGITYYIDLKTGDYKDVSRDYNNANERNVIKNIVDKMLQIIN
jgi:hypothetical protein